MSGDSGSPYEQTARVLRASLDRVAKHILAHLTDATRRRDGSLVYPELTLRQLGARMGAKGYSASTLKRKLRLLVDARLLKMHPRKGRSYVFVPLVDQLPLSLSAAAQQPALLPPGPGALELRASPAPAVRGARGRFVVVPVGGDFHNPGQFDRTPVEILTGPLLEFAAAEAANPGQIDRTPRSNLPDTPVDLTGVGACTKEVQISDHRSENTPDAGALPLVGIPMTAEQRRARARDVGSDSNANVLLAMAFHLGTDPSAWQQYSAVPIDSEDALREALKRFAAQSLIQYGLTGASGEGVVRLAAWTAWKSLVRRGVKFDPIETKLESRRERWRKAGRPKR